ncbi:MAG: hypothetical protein ABSG84_10770 [Acidobacteriaceae bacterium]|jgi:hypothetical protein
MLRARVQPAAVLSRAGIVFALALFGIPLHSTAASSATAAAPVAAPQSDPAAIQAMENVLVQSGGVGVWSEMRSAEESFSVLGVGEKTPHVMMLLDDWSLITTRYRRGVQGQITPPSDHNGTATFPLNTGLTQIAVPEFDQARTLVPRLPAAAAEVMLRRQEYVIKISNLQHCSSGDICLDVYRMAGSSQFSVPEQQWKISSTTGLPTTIRYQTTTVGPSSGTMWEEIFFLRYSNEDGVIVPVSLLVSRMGQRQFWTFISFTQNVGFDTAKFDQEIAQ